MPTGHKRIASAGVLDVSRRAFGSKGRGVKSKTLQGKSLQYIALEPDAYDPSRPLPMVVLAHGFGSNMADLAGLAELIDSHGYVYVCSNAPIEMRFGFRETGYAWADRYDRSTSEQWRSAEEKLNVLVDETMESYGVPPGKVVLGGFSQGGMMSFLCGLTRPELYAGIIAMSAGLPDPEGLQSRLPQGNKPPVFISHGDMDSMIPVDEARDARVFLESEGYSVYYREYRMGHQITHDVLRDLKAWLGPVLPPGPLKL